MYAKHRNLIDADASGAKASTKHLESRFVVSRSFKVTHLVITEKPTRDCLLLHNNVGFRVGHFEGKI